MVNSMTRADGEPRELELVRLFVNTLDVEQQAESLADPGDLAAWLAEHGLAPAGTVTQATDLAEAVALREALRTLLLANNGVEADVAAATVTLDDAARLAGLTLRFGADGSTRLEPAAAGVRGALGRLLAGVAAAMAAGTWTRLKACRAEDCRWAFYDHARNQSRSWCSMRVCGNREKARAYRRRRAAD
jgi:predicted RNA-binding Zn ribbon-like protein